MTLLRIPSGTLRCSCGMPACRVIQPKSVWQPPIPICRDCVELLAARLPIIDKSIFCDLYHTTWLIYDFHPHTP